MATCEKLPSGKWQVRVRRQGHTLTRSFRLKNDADAWARDQEGRIDKGETPMGKPSASREFPSLIDLHFADMAELRRAFGRSKEATLLRLKEYASAPPASLISPATASFNSPSVVPKMAPDPSPSASTSASSAPSWSTQPPSMA